MTTKIAAKHTPGPWTAEDDGDSLDIYGKDGSCVATVRHPQEATTSREVNARLIAAAPELLTAAKALRAALLKGDPQYSLNAEEGAALNALDLAITKAELDGIAAPLSWGDECECGQARSKHDGKTGMGRNAENGCPSFREVA